MTTTVKKWGNSAAVRKKTYDLIGLLDGITSKTCLRRSNSDPRKAKKAW